MDSVMQFLAMGGYAAYVWPALGIAAAVMTVLLVQSIRSLRACEDELARFGNSQDARRDSK